MIYIIFYTICILFSNTIFAADTYPALETYSLETLLAKWEQINANSQLSEKENMDEQVAQVCAYTLNRQSRSIEYTHPLGTLLHFDPVNSIGFMGLLLTGIEHELTVAQLVSSLRCRVKELKDVKQLLEKVEATPSSPNYEISRRGLILRMVDNFEHGYIPYLQSQELFPKKIELEPLFYAIFRNDPIQIIDTILTAPFDKVLAASKK